MAKVNFIRRHTDVEVDEEPIVDGNFIVTGDGNIYIDYGLERIKIVGGGGGSTTGDTLPIGSITAYGKETAPANWLICDGSEVNRNTYSDLFKVIGTKYGEGDGSTTFNLPNLKGRVPVGLDSDDTNFGTIGKIGGEKDVTLTIDKIPEHQHGEFIEYGDGKQPYTLASGGGTNKNGYFLNAQTTAYSGPQVLTEKTGGGQSHNNLQPYEVNNFIIKAFQSAGVVANVVKTKTESDNDVYSCNYINTSINEINNNINETKSDLSRKVATAFLTNSISDVTSSLRLNLQGFESTTDKLTLSNGGIRIGAGISKVLISGNYFNVTSNTTGYCWSRISRNNDDVSLAIDQNNVNFASCSHSPKIQTVTEGDIIYLWKWDDNKCDIRGGNVNTWLTVDVVS